jgi:hypothetical protein
MREEETSLSLSGEWDSEEAVRLSEALFDALAMTHKLPNSIKYLPGMSGSKYRYLINNLVQNTPDARYLEVGSWKGSTACSAMYGNKVTAVCIDDWSETMQGVHARDDFLKNTNAVKTDDINFTFIESDFNKVNFETLGKFNIYLYDGSHAEADQYNGITRAQPALDDVYTLIVDDWNGPDSQNGTLKALADLGQTIVARIDIITRRDGQHPILHSENSDWHNGYCIAVVKKPQNSG